MLPVRILLTTTPALLNFRLQQKLDFNDAVDKGATDPRRATHSERSESRPETTAVVLAAMNMARDMAHRFLSRHLSVAQQNLSAAARLVRCG